MPSSWRSWMLARSISASAAKMVQMSLPCSGPAVAYMQSLLVKQGRELPKSVKKNGLYGYDGQWQKETDEQFRVWQATHKDLDGNPLEVDGTCGPLSWGALLGTPCK